MSEHRYAVIIAGGDERLWVKDSDELPIEMQDIVSRPTLLQEIFSRLNQLLPSTHIYLSTTKNYEKISRRLLPDIEPDNFIVEPAIQGPATAYAVASEVIYRRDPEAIVFSVSSDKVVSKVDDFLYVVESAYEFIEKNPDSIALAGMKPSFADPQKGYIKVDAKIQSNPRVYSVEKFVEKPSRKIAEYYTESEEYYWSLAYYCFFASTLRAAYREANELIYDSTIRYVDSGKTADFEAIPRQLHEIELINTHKFPLRVILFERRLDYLLASVKRRIATSVKKLEELGLAETTGLRLSVWRLRRAARRLHPQHKDVLSTDESVGMGKKVAQGMYRRVDNALANLFPKIIKTTPKHVAVTRLREMIDELGYTVVDQDSSRPWGAFFRMADDEIERFMEEFFPGLTMEAAKLGHDEVVLSPKFLLVSPGHRLSWQYHYRRAEIWRFLSDGAYYKSSTDRQGGRKPAPVGRVVQFKQGERHRLTSAHDAAYTLVAEIWQHTNPDEPSNEEDIVRLADDYGRQRP